MRFLSVPVRKSVKRSLQAFTASAPSTVMLSLITHKKKKNHMHKEHKKGGGARAVAKYKRQKAEAIKAPEAAAKVAIEAAQGEAAANSESLRCTTTAELANVTSVLKKVNKAAANLGSWVRRASTQHAQFVDEPHKSSRSTRYQGAHHERSL